MTSIYGEPAVIRRLERISSFDALTSNGSLAAAAMLGAAFIALIVANTPIYQVLIDILQLPIEIGIGSTIVSVSIEAFVNDFLMAIFFLLVGIELKYEVTVGQLRRPKQALLPMLAAVGGVCVPALLYLLLNRSETAQGWAIPIATDIAFALGVVSLLKGRILPETKVFFQTLAIMDDILAIVVIALFYGHTPDPAWTMASVAATLVLVWLHQTHVYSLRPYFVVGAVLWVCMYNSGIHATLAGIILAFCLPSRSDVHLSRLGSWLSTQAHELEDSYDSEHHVLGQHDFTQSSVRIERVMHHVTPPLQRMEHHISVFVSFVVLPLFAFVNAELHLVGENFGLLVSNPVALGVYFGAVLGKPIGIISVTMLLSYLPFFKLPKRMDFKQVCAVGILGGIGFTMSILISGLAFGSGDFAVAAKCAILLASVSSALLGLLFVRFVIAAPAKKPDAAKNLNAAKKPDTANKPQARGKKGSRSSSFVHTFRKLGRKQGVHHHQTANHR